MKKIIAILMCVVFVLSALSACAKKDIDPTPDDSTNNNNDNNNNVTEEEDSAPVLKLDGVEPIIYTTLRADDTYVINSNERLRSFFERPLETFFGFCKYFDTNDWELYNYDIKNGNHFATYTKGKDLSHIYWIECEEELNLVTSKTGGKNIPPKTPAVTAGSEKTSVTQVQSDAINGMGYVIKLADGSFIIYDGGGYDRADALWNVLVDLNGGANGIVIRAWLITHPHADHYPCFMMFGAMYGEQVKLETVMVSPANESDSDDKYFHQYLTEDITLFKGAKLLYVHTGMTFNFCNVKLEILFTADELFISDPTRDEGLTENNNPNNASIISRVYTDDYSAIFLGDASEESALRAALYYGDYLKSDMCQVAHHGVEDFPLIAYRFIKPAILFYPCSQSLYSSLDRDHDVRKALAESKYTKEIILHDKASETREFGAGK